MVKNKWSGETIQGAFFRCDACVVPVANVPSHTQCPCGPFQIRLI